MTTCSFFVSGKPIAQPRPKVTVRGGRGHAYVPEDHPVHDWRELVRTYAAGNVDDPFTERLTLTLWFYMPRPKSHCGTGKNSTQLKASAPEFHTTRPDLDNLVKAVKDAMEGVAYEDDKQVSHIEACKVWAVPGDAGVRVTLQV